MANILWCFRCNREVDETCVECPKLPECEYVPDGDEEREDET